RHTDHTARGSITNVSKRVWLETNLNSKRSAKNPQSVVPTCLTSQCMASKPSADNCGLRQFPKLNVCFFKRFELSDPSTNSGRAEGRAAHGELVEPLERAAVLSLRDTLSDAGSCATCARSGCCRSPSPRRAA